MAISLLFLIFLISIPLTSATSPSSTMPPTPQDPSPPHQVLILPPILSSLGYITLASALPSLSSPILSSWNGPVTLFAPSDSSLHSCLHSSCTPLRLLRDHIVPGLFPLQSLLSLPFSSKLSTASPGRCLTLTSTSALNSSNPNPKLFVNDLEITKPDLFNNGQVVIHGIQGFIAPLSPFSCLHHVAPPRRAPGFVTGSVVPLMLEDTNHTISRLHKNGYGFVALAMRVKYPVLVSLNNMTIFTLTDGAIFTGGAHEYVTEVQFHIVSDQLMSHEDLIKLPTVSSFALSTAPLPPPRDGSFAKDFLGQLCSYPSWRDYSNTWRKEISVFGLLLATNFLNWYLVIQFRVDDRYQSYIYLTCSILNMIPVFLYPSKYYSVWECVKLASMAIFSAVSLIIDAGLYYDFGHLWSIAAIFVYNYGDTALVHIISSVSTSLSSFIQIACLLCTDWNHVPLEIDTAYLNALYTFWSIFVMCRPIQMVLALVAFGARCLYAILLTNRARTRGLIITCICGGNENARTRPSRSWNDIVSLLEENIRTPVAARAKILCILVGNLLKQIKTCLGRVKDCMHTS